jgi:branched-chain amino acid transport system substrate-binding protein
LSAALVALSVAACSSSSSPSASSSSSSTGSSSAGSSSSSGSYTVQIIGDESGAGAAANGVPATQGYETAFDAANATGGINGHKIKYAVQDSQSDAQGGSAAAEAAVAANPTAIVAGNLSSAFVPEVPVFDQANIPVYSIVGGDAWYFPPKPWLYSDSTTDYQYGTAMATQLERQLGGSLKGKRVAEVPLAIPGIQEDLTPASASIIKTMGGQVVTTQVLAVTATSFASQAQDIINAKAQGVVTCGISSNLVLIVQALETAGFKGPIVGCQGEDDSLTLQKLNDPQLSVLRLVNQQPAGGTMDQLAQKYGHSSNGAYFAQGFILGEVLIKALTACGYPCSSSQLESATNSLGEFTIATDHVLFGPLDLTAQRRYALTAVQYFSWDASTGQAVASGPPVSVTAGEAP